MRNIWLETISTAENWVLFLNFLHLKTENEQALNRTFACPHQIPLQY